MRTVHFAVLPPSTAWARLKDMQQVVIEQPVVAYAVQCLPLYEGMY